MKVFRLSILLLCLVTTANAQLKSDFDRKMNAPTEPFTIINNIHYVGTDDLAIFLITTPKGHILIDGGFRETVDQIESNVEKLGFKFNEIKVLLVNHTHPDHAGGLFNLKEKTGASLYVTKRQKKQLKRGGKKDFRFGDDMTFDEVQPDKTLSPGSRFSFGGQRILVLETPGHTKDTLSFMTTTEVEGARYQVMFAGSLSSLDYDLINNKQYKKHAKEFQSTFDLMRTLKVDIFLTSHAQFFNMKAKREALKQKPARNPFWDPRGYSEYVSNSEASFRKKLATQKAEDK